MTLRDFFPPKLRPPKTWSDKCLKSPDSEDASTSNMVNVPNHCWNLHRSTFFLFNDQFQLNWVGKTLCYWHPKLWEHLWAHWLTMKSILFLRETIERYQFRCNSLTKTNVFLTFLLHFWNLDKILNILSKNITLIDFVISKLRTPKTWSDKCLKSPVSEEPSTSNIVNVLKLCWNLHQCIFILLFDHWKVNWFGNILCYWHARSWDCFLKHWLPMKCILFLREII